MTRRARAMNAGASKRSSSPSGGRFFTARRATVSGAFINSLSKDGVSEGTIRQIKHDNEKRSNGGEDHRAAEDAS